MQIHQILLTDPSEVGGAMAPHASLEPTVVLAFGAVSYFEQPAVYDQLRRLWPRAVIAGCSTAGEIRGGQVHDGACVVTAVRFDRASAQGATTRLDSMGDSFAAGARLAAALAPAGLRAVLVLGTGVRINGSALVRGLQSTLPAAVSISGGLAADGGAFERTWTMGGDGCGDDRIVAVGLYGDGLRLGYGSFAGWVPFGPARRVTRCVDNVLYELDGERALDIYKRYLGEHAARLPSSGLLFPFEMIGERQEKRGIFRTILGVDEAQGSLTLAGDIDPNGSLKLMYSNTERLIDGAETAARTAFEMMGPVPQTSLALLVSCVGRKLVMGARVDEEVEAVADLFGPGATVTGYYSNGEIAGNGFNGGCHLHNQTMTITWIAEDTQ
jgi:hypothetical protein